MQIPGRLSFIVENELGNRDDPCPARNDIA